MTAGWKEENIQIHQRKFWADLRKARLFVLQILSTLRWRLSVHSPLAQTAVYGRAFSAVEQRNLRRLQQRPDGTLPSRQRSEGSLKQTRRVLQLCWCLHSHVAVTTETSQFICNANFVQNYKKNGWGKLWRCNKTSWTPVMFPKPDFTVRQETVWFKNDSLSSFSHNCWSNFQ